MKLQKLLSYTRRAIEKYEMIDNNDKIAIGISGGKDSLTLAIALKNLQRFLPKKFEIEAITVSMGFENTDYTIISNFFKKLEINYSIVDTDIGKIIFEDRKEKNPCSLCSKMKKGALHEKAISLGCNKIALGHNKDDSIQTFLMSLFYEGRLHCFSPVSYLDRSNLYTIRPLIYTPEKEIETFIKNNNIPIIESNCPADGNTKREETKKLISLLKEKYTNLDNKIIGALERENLSSWK